MSEQLVRITVRQGDQRETVQYPDFRDGSRCGLRIRYSAYDQRWRLWVLALDGSTISGPCTIVPGTDLFSGLRHDPRVPRGQLFVYSYDRASPNNETIDKDAILYYRRAT